MDAEDNQPPHVIVIAWYRAKDYARIRALAPDGGGLQKTFREWKDSAERRLAEIRSKFAIPVEKVHIDPDALADFLRRENIESSAETRARFAHYEYGRTRAVQ